LVDICWEDVVEVTVCPLVEVVDPVVVEVVVVSVSLEEIGETVVVDVPFDGEDVISDTVVVLTEGVVMITFSVDVEVVVTSFSPQPRIINLSIEPSVSVFFTNLNRICVIRSLRFGISIFSTSYLLTLLSTKIAQSTVFSNMTSILKLVFN
jgi:hypothetical protein